MSESNTIEFSVADLDLPDVSAPKSKKTCLYSVVIPVYKSEKIVGETIKQVLAFFENAGLRGEVVLVNDGSPDDSWKVISKAAAESESVVAVDLLKNYGQHTAVFCGVQMSKGDFIITMDDDLQNPPEEIIKLIDRVHEGFDLVFGRFPSKKHAEYRKVGSRVVNYLNGKIFNKPKGIVLSNFRIFSRVVAERISGHQTFYPYIPGLLLMYSSSIGNVDTLHAERTVGGSNYTFTRIAKLLARLLFNYSSYPLKVLTIIGSILAITGFFIGIWFVAKAILYGSSVPGWTTLVVMLSIFNGFTIIMLGVIGEYVSRILKQISIESPYQIGKVVR